MGSDYLLVPPSVSLWGTNIGASADLEQKLRAVEQVDVVSSLRFAESKVNENSVSVLGINPHDYPWAGGLTFVDGSESDYDQLNDGRSMFINSIFAMTVGAKKGDVIELATTDGRKPYRVAAVVNDLLNAKVTTVFISQKNMEKDFQVTEDIFIQVNLKENADINAADAAIKTAASGYDQFTVISGKEYSQSLMNHCKQLFRFLLFADFTGCAFFAGNVKHTVHRRHRTDTRNRNAACSGRNKKTNSPDDDCGRAPVGCFWNHIGYFGRALSGFLFVKGLEPLCLPNIFSRCPVFWLLSLSG
jgi:putative ABC transport system permease protein